MKNYKTVIGAAAVGLALTAVSSQAQLNLTGGSVIGFINQAPLTGVAPGSNFGAPNGFVSSWVIQGAASDPTGLIFLYQDINGGLGAIDNAEFTGFPGPDVLTGVGQTGAYATLIGAPALPGSSAPSGPGGFFPAYNVFGGTVTFENGNMPAGGFVSDYLAVLTTDTLFTRNFGQIQDGFSADGPTLAPAAPVPEASTVVAGALMLLPLGIGAVRALRKERTA